MNNNIPNNNALNENISIINNKVNTNNGKVLSESEKTEIINLVKKIQDESESYYDNTLIQDCDNIIKSTNDTNNTINNRLTENLNWNNYNNDVSKIREIFLNLNNLINQLGNGLEEKKTKIEEQINKCSRIKNIYKNERERLEKRKNENDKVSLSTKQFYYNQINLIREVCNKIDRYIEIYDQYLLKINSLIISCNKNKLVYSTKFKNKLYNTFLNHYSAKINNNSKKIIKINNSNSNKNRLEKLINNRKIVNDILKIFNKVTNIINANPLKLKAINKFNPEIERLKEKINAFKSDLDNSIELFKNKVTDNITKLTNNIKEKTDQLKDEIKKCIGKLIKSNIPGLKVEYEKLNVLIHDLEEINNNNKDFENIKKSLNEVSKMKINNNLDLVKEKLQDIINKLQLNLSNSGGIIDPTKSGKSATILGKINNNGNNNNSVENQYRNINNSNRNNKGVIKQNSYLSWNMINKNKKEKKFSGKVLGRFPYRSTNIAPKYLFEEVKINDVNTNNYKSKPISEQMMTKIKIKK